MMGKFQNENIIMTGLILHKSFVLIPNIRNCTLSIYEGELEGFCRGHEIFLEMLMGHEFFIFFE